VNASVSTLTERLCFKKVKELPAVVVYAETGLGGYSTIQINAFAEDSKLDLELLFNAVSQKQEQITNLLMKPAYV